VTPHKVAGALYIVSEKVPADALKLFGMNGDNSLME